MTLMCRQHIFNQSVISQAANQSITKNQTGRSEFNYINIYIEDMVLIQKWIVFYSHLIHEMQLRSFGKETFHWSQWDRWEWIPSAVLSLLGAALIKGYLCFGTLHNSGLEFCVVVWWADSLNVTIKNKWILSEIKN